MGRPRSWYRRTCDDCLAIDVREWSRSGRFLPPSSFTCLWAIGGRPAGSIRVQTDSDSVSLRYRVSSNDGEWNAVEQRISIEWTACPYGGRRPWFLCVNAPGGRNCARRVAKLYLKGQVFACRLCHRLTYASQSEDRLGRAIRCAQNIRTRLGKNAGLLGPFPARPKGMHRTTYWRLFHRSRLAENGACGMLAEVFKACS
jgi:hypothetical protein